MQYKSDYTCFTNSTQAIVPGNTSIILAPTSGTATVNSATGQITYTPNAGLTADTTDSFIYYIEGNGNPASFEYFKIIINTDVLQTTNASLTSCADSNGNGTFQFKLSQCNTRFGNYGTVFHQCCINRNSHCRHRNYSGPAGTIYANVTSSYGCTKVAQITLTTTPSPNINTGNYNATLCDDNFDGIVNVNFPSILLLL
jgi:hypothetical protein